MPADNFSIEDDNVYVHGARRKFICASAASKLRFDGVQDVFDQF